MIEPWDFRFQAGDAERLLGTYIPRESLQPINQRYYRDLGADLEHMGTLYDLSPRPEKAALAYMEFVTHGRMVNGVWRPTVARVSDPYERGGLFVLNELVHENGHVVNSSAIRNRPAFVDWPSDLFAEAFADVPSWSTYEPVWQRSAAISATKLRSNFRCGRYIPLLFSTWPGPCSNCGCFALP